MSKLRALTNFYATHLPSDDPRKQAMETIAQRLNAYQLSTIYEPAFEQMRTDLEKLESQQNQFNLTDRALNRAKFANKHMYTIFKEMDHLASIEDSSRRELAANALTEASGVEPGFFGKGVTEKQRRTDLINRTNSLLLTHAISRKVNKLPEMVQAMGNGDGCLTGVMSRVGLFAVELAGLGQIKDTDERRIGKPIAFSISQVLSRTLERMQEEQELPEDQADEIAIGWLKQWKPSILSEDALFKDFIATLKITMKPESNASRPFLFNLLEKGVIQDLHSINWEETGSKLFDLPQFRDWFLQGRQLTLYDFTM